MVINTADDEDDSLRKPILEFYSTIAGLEATEPPHGPTGPNPSRPSNIWSSLFTFHPVASHEPPSWLLAAPCDYRDGCAICIDDFDPGQSIAQLHCSHLFHYTCIRMTWDRQGIHTYRCPKCNSDSVRWRLHEQAGITPEVQDVWDNHTRLPEGTPGGTENPDFADSDVENIYWQLEIGRQDVSNDWRVDMGPRETNIEMVHLRQLRRRRNKLRRTIVAQSAFGNIMKLDKEAAVNPMGV